MDDKENMAPVEPDKKRNGWFVAAAAFGAVIIVAGLAMTLAASGDTDEDITSAGVDDNPVVTTQPPTTTATPTTEASAAAQAPTTTQATTTTAWFTIRDLQNDTAEATKALPFIGRGVYAIPDEVAPGTYRHWGTLTALLDENMEIVDTNFHTGTGFGLVIVQPTDSFISVGGWIITVEDFGRPIDPIAEGALDGEYLVGYDLEPGRYEVQPNGFQTPYWARLDDAMGIIDSGTGDGTLEVIVEASDFALEFQGNLRLIP